MENFLDPLSQQVIGRFFASDSAGAEHCNAFSLEAVAVCRPPCREITKAVGLRVFRTGKAADRNLIAVSGIDNSDILSGNQLIPVRRINVSANGTGGVDVWLPHGHDLSLKADPHAPKRHFMSVAFFDLKTIATRQSADMLKQGVDRRTISGDRSVYAFTCKQNRSAQTVFAAQVFQSYTHRVRRFETRKMIKGSDDKHGRRVTLGG